MKVLDVLEEFAGCAVCSLLSAFAFFLPDALGIEPEYSFGTQAVLYFSSLLIYELFRIKSVMNPATHFQKVWRFGSPYLLEFLVFSAMDLFGYIVGNWTGLYVLHMIDPTVSFIPGPPQCNYLHALAIEAFLFFILQVFGERGPKNIYIQSAFITAAVFVFVEITGAYGNPIAYYSKVLLAAPTRFPEFVSVYLLGPFLGALAALPFIETPSPQPTTTKAQAGPSAKGTSSSSKSAKSKKTD